MPEPAIDRLYRSLAPTVALALWRGTKTARAAGLPVHLFEGLRTAERQDWLYASGRTRPGKIVTNATSKRGYHCWGLAGDVVFKKDDGTWHWPPAEDPRWKEVASFLKPMGLSWGGDWTRPDVPHFQHALMPSSPTDGYIELVASRGYRALWTLVGADAMKILDAGISDL